MLAALFSKLTFRLPLRRRLRRLGILALAPLMAIALASCNPAALRTQAAQVPRLVISELSEPKTFNTVMSKEATSVFGLLYDSLIAQNGLTGELEPAIAESWDISDDQQRIVFTLREGLRWSDGEPFTIDDITFTYNNIYFNEQIPSGERDILRIGEEGAFPEVRKVDERRVEFIAPEPFAPLLRYAGGLAVLPKHALETAVTSVDAEGRPRFLSTWGTDANPTTIIGNGPYRIKGYATGERVIFERNPYYWRQGAQGEAQPYVDEFVIQIVESTDNALMQFRSGGLDVIGVSPNYFALLKREENRGGFNIYNGGPTLSTTFLSFNLNKGSRNGRPLVNPIRSRWFNMQEFRQAVAYGIDRQTMINNIYQGLGEPQNSPIAVQSPYHLSAEDGLRVYNYDPDKARSLLIGAGFQYNNQGQLLDSEGNRVRFTLITNSGNQIREAMGAQIKQDLAKLGIQVDFQPLAFNTLVSRLSDSLEWEAHILGFSGAGVEPDGSRNIWSPNGSLHAFNQQPLAGQDPIEGWEVADWEAEIGRLYVQGSQELDEERRKAIYAQTQKLAQEYLPFIHLVNPLALSAVRDRVEGVQFSALGGTLWNVHELRLAEQ